MHFSQQLNCQTYGRCYGYTHRGNLFRLSAIDQSSLARVVLPNPVFSKVDELLSLSSLFTQRQLIKNPKLLPSDTSNRLFIVSKLFDSLVVVELFVKKRLPFQRYIEVLGPVDKFKISDGRRTVIGNNVQADIFVQE